MSHSQVALETGQDVTKGLAWHSESQNVQPNYLHGVVVSEEPTQTGSPAKNTQELKEHHMVGEEMGLDWRPPGALLPLLLPVEFTTEGRDQEWKEQEDVGDAEDGHEKRHGREL